jgi:galactose mutarotase-like enzyme
MDGDEGMSMEARQSRDGDTDSVVLGNTAVEVTVLVGKGADIISITDRDSGVNPLWKARWGNHHVHSALAHESSGSAWLASCTGGWNVLFPGGGAESTVGGAIQPMHGEASIVPWSIESIGVGDDGPSVTMRTHLTRSPFKLERTVRLVGETSEVVVTDTAINEGGESFPFTWTHHPTLGPPFLSDRCAITTNATEVVADETYDLPGIPLPAGSRMPWSEAKAALGPVVGRGMPRQLLSYLLFQETTAWYRVTNQELDLSFEARWLTSEMPYAWFFQEMDATAGYPWFSNTYIMALEPSTTWPGRGLAHAVDIDRVQWLSPGEAKSVSISVSFGRAER